MPAEWLPHDAIWLSWPHNRDTWPTRLAEAREEFINLARTISDVTPVRILGGGGIETSVASDVFASDSNIEVVDIKTNDAWIRDYGPTFVHTESGAVAVVGWRYNAWGGKYPPFDDDQQVARSIAMHLDLSFELADLCFEGGGLEISRDGILLCTTSCALDENRNPGMEIETIETLFAEYLGATSIVWLPGEGIEGDDTDGHIDQLARFVDNTTLVYAWTADETDPQHSPLARNLADLRTGLNSVGDSFRLVPLPLPAKPVTLDGARLPASYCNFLITNGLVVVPQFGDENDSLAVETLATLLPDHKVSGLPSLNLSAGLGSFHCLSQQQPAAKRQTIK